MPTAEHLPTADEMGMKGRRACEIVGSKSCALRCAGAEAACESGLVAPVAVRSVRPLFQAEGGRELGRQAGRQAGWLAREGREGGRE